MTTNQIITIARNKLLEKTDEILSDEVILIYANLAQQDIYKRTFPADQIKSATVSFSSGIGTPPIDYGTLYGFAYDSATNPFEEVSIDDFSSKSTAARVITVEAGSLKVKPTNTPSLTVRYYPTYPELSVSQNPIINSYFHELIVYGILSRAFEDLQDEQLGLFYSNKYEAELTKKIGAQSNYEENNQRGGQMFVDQQLVSDGRGYTGGSTNPNYF